MKLNAADIPRVGRALTEQASGCDMRVLLRRGYVAVMADGRPVVKLPVRDAYFREVRPLAARTAAEPGA